MSTNFDRAAEYYDATRGYDPQVADAIGKALGVAAGATRQTRFLEIGVGTGRLALPVVAQGYEYTGVDISLRMMERLRDKLDDMERTTGRAPRVTLREADMTALPFPDSSFDAVIAAHVFHLVADPWRAAQEALRVLRPGGVLLICGDSIIGREPFSVNEAWRTIVREVYGALPISTEAVAQLISDIEVSDPSIQVDELRPVSWEVTTTVNDELETIRKRLWSNTWVLPDAVFDQCLARLVAWCQSTFAGRMDEPLPRSAEFVIRRVRRPAA